MRERMLREISYHASFPSCAMQEGNFCSAEIYTPNSSILKPRAHLEFEAILGQMCPRQEGSSASPEIISQTLSVLTSAASPEFNAPLTSTRQYLEEEGECL